MAWKELLPLVGVILGWSLKAFSDYLVSRQVEARTFRKATFYLLKDYKALLDYDRGTTYFRRNKPTVAEFEAWRAVLEARFLEDAEANRESVSTAIDLLASVDPPVAIRLHNTLRNMAFAFRKNLSEVAEQDEATYAQLVYNQDELVAFTLKDLEATLLHAAKRSGLLQYWKVRKWLRDRAKGEEDYMKGMEEKAEVREQALGLARQAGGKTPRNASE